MKQFKLHAVSKKARAGTLKTAHGKIQTPFFMPVATKASVKLLSNEEVEGTGTQCLISNAFILYLKPGLETIKKHKGLRNFMQWKHSLFTDSGGFQVLSPDFCLKLSNSGVLFRNPFDGKKMLFTPELSIKIQNSLGSDVAMCLDDVPIHSSSLPRLTQAVNRTIDWAQRCKKAHKNKKQLLFCINQGGTVRELREKSISSLLEIGFDGMAFGGLCIGETKEKMFRTIGATITELPESMPRYLMGVGSIRELVESIALGIDCFDSCFPTRTARHGKAFSSKGSLNIAAAKFKNDLKPLDKECNCFVCKTHSRAYLHHLFKTKEENGMKYLSYHNLFFLQNLMKKIREDIKAGSFKPEKYA
ncbi:MAG: tRNA guanosine(34) transglycosylase Tgt [Candidatus Diapherotrites archaeon]|nr:tRNA guanosine(34) transglycosylase Tgt [Candidatus Diapherotrites archaeon]